MRKIYARNTKVESITIEAAILFMEEHHRQGSASLGKNARAYGLAFENELLAVAIFCNPRTRGKQKEYTTELFRLAFKSDVQVVGGASKLIKYFMATGAWDLFTYQDTSGEATSVYEHAGMKLVGKENPTPKEIFVKDGLTVETAANNRLDWFSKEQVVTRGPDALLKIELGEQFKENGSRKTNVQLFLENGYHLETVPGDRVYEWHNPKVNFYTYKITSTVKPGYYYGRHAVVGEINKEIALKDGYMGSGGKKFQYWKSSIPSESLVKEILGFYSTWKQVVIAETELIGSNHILDELCLNFQPGGTGMVRMPQTIALGQCQIHGQVAHRGKSCMSCSAASVFELRECLIHGKVSHQKDVCVTCTNDKKVAIKQCAIHGYVKHRGNSCYSCVREESLKLKQCSIHGLTTHQGEACARCTAALPHSKRMCVIHGKVSFQGDVCLICRSAEVFKENHCSIHGLTIHHGNSCVTCSSHNSFSMRECSLHGVVKHRGKSCTVCAYEKGTKYTECPIHGVTIHRGENCMSCNTQDQFNLRECSTHGLVNHKGEACTLCTAQKSFTSEQCAIHGKSRHHAGKCVKCRLGSHLAEENCAIHGATKHRGGKCVKCSYEATISFQECSIHGSTKHRSNKCMACSGEKGAEKRRSKGKEISQERK